MKKIHIELLVLVLLSILVINPCESLICENVLISKSVDFETTESNLADCDLSVITGVENDFCEGATITIEISGSSIYSLSISGFLVDDNITTGAYEIGPYEPGIYELSVIDVNDPDCTSEQTLDIVEELPQWINDLQWNYFYPVPINAISYDVGGDRHFYFSPCNPNTNYSNVLTDCEGTVLCEGSDQDCAETIVSLVTTEISCDELSESTIANTSCIWDTTFYDLGYPGFEYAYQVVGYPEYMDEPLLDNGQILQFMPYNAQPFTIVIAHFSPIGGPVSYINLEVSVSDAVVDCSPDLCVIENPFEEIDWFQAEYDQSISVIHYKYNEPGSVGQDVFIFQYCDSALDGADYVLMDCQQNELCWTGGFVPESCESYFPALVYQQHYWPGYTPEELVDNCMGLNCAMIPGDDFEENDCGNCLDTNNPFSIFCYPENTQEVCHDDTLFFTLDYTGLEMSFTLEVFSSQEEAQAYLFEPGEGSLLTVYYIPPPDFTGIDTLFLELEDSADIDWTRTIEIEVGACNDLCQIDNPFEDLEWFQEEYDNSLGVIQYTYEGENVFLFQYCSTAGVDPDYAIVDCQQNTICVSDGTLPFPNCDVYLSQLDYVQHDWPGFTTEELVDNCLGLNCAFVPGNDFATDGCGNCLAVNDPQFDDCFPDENQTLCYEDSLYLTYNVSTLVVNTSFTAASNNGAIIEISEPAQMTNLTYYPPEGFFGLDTVLVEFREFGVLIWDQLLVIEVEDCHCYGIIENPFEELDWFQEFYDQSLGVIHYKYHAPNELNPLGRDVFLFEFCTSAFDGPDYIIIDCQQNELCTTGGLIPPPYCDEFLPFLEYIEHYWPGYTPEEYTESCLNLNCAFVPGSDFAENDCGDCLNVNDPYFDVCFPDDNQTVCHDDTLFLDYNLFSGGVNTYLVPSSQNAGSIEVINGSESTVIYYPAEDFVGIDTLLIEYIALGPPVLIQTLYIEVGPCDELCQIDNPFEELSWFQDVYDNSLNVVQYDYFGSSVFVFEYCDGDVDGTILSIVDCNGDIVCQEDMVPICNEILQELTFVNFYWPGYTDDSFNWNCLTWDCDYTIYGTEVEDECGNCLEPDDPDFDNCATQYYDLICNDETLAALIINPQPEEIEGPQIYLDPQNGTVSLDLTCWPNCPDSLEVSYTPNPGFVGQDIFSYVWVNYTTEEFFIDEYIITVQDCSGPCEINDILQDLLWINDTLAAYYPIPMSVNEYTHEGQTIILLSSCVPGQAFSGRLYDCQGNLLCDLGTSINDCDLLLANGTFVQEWISCEDIGFELEYLVGEMCTDSIFELDLGHPGFEFLWEVYGPSTGGTALIESDGQTLKFYPEIGSTTGSFAIVNYSPIGGPAVQYLDFEITIDPCDEVWPGDVNFDGIADNIDILYLGLQFGSFGIPRENASTDWIAQEADDWDYAQVTGVNAKHADCDGDGVISLLDKDVVDQNYDQTHESGKTDLDGPPVFADIPETILAGEEVSIPIILGNVDEMVQDFYGLAFTLEFDKDLVEEGSISFDFNTEFLGTDEQDVMGLGKVFFEDGEIDLAVTKIDQQNESGNGAILTVSLVMIDDIIGKSDQAIPFNINVTNATGISLNGDEIDLSTRDSEAEVYSSITTLVQSDFEIYPNPTNGIININSKGELLDGIEMVDLTGKVILNESKINSNNYKLELTNVQSGIYILNIQTNQGVLRKKIEVLK